jgi:hypothetical protein
MLETGLFIILMNEATTLKVKELQFLIRTTKAKINNFFNSISFKKTNGDCLLFKIESRNKKTTMFSFQKVSN